MLYMMPELLLSGLGFLTLIFCLSRYKNSEVLRHIVLYLQALILGRAFFSYSIYRQSRGI